MKKYDVIIVEKTIFNLKNVESGIYIYCEVCGLLHDLPFMDIGSTWCGGHEGVDCNNFPTFPVCILNHEMFGYCEKCHEFKKVIGYQEIIKNKRISQLLCDKCLVKLNIKNNTLTILHEEILCNVCNGTGKLKHYDDLGKCWKCDGKGKVILR